MATQKPVSKSVSQPKPKPITDVPAIFSTDNRTENPIAPLPAIRDYVKVDDPLDANPYHGLSEQPVPEKSAIILMAPLDPNDVEIRPDGILYYPEIKYRRVLNKAFGPAGWGLMPRGEFTRMENTLIRPYALFVAGRFVSESQGEMEYQEKNPEMTWATTSEGVKSNALMRCCKDLGIASELWDPVFINDWIKKYTIQVWRRGRTWPNGKPKPFWRRKDRDPFYDETGIVGEKKPQQQANPEPEPYVNKTYYEKHGGSKEHDSRDGSPPPASGESNRPGIGNSPEYIPPTKAHADLKTMVDAQMKVEDVSESQILLKLSSWPDKKLKDGTLKKGFGGVSTYEGMSEKLALYCIKTFNEIREKARKAKQLQETMKGDERSLLKRKEAFMSEKERKKDRDTLYSAIAVLYHEAMSGCYDGAEGAIISHAREAIEEALRLWDKTDRILSEVTTNKTVRKPIGR